MYHWDDDALHVLHVAMQKAMYLCTDVQCVCKLDVESEVPSIILIRVCSKAVIVGYIMN